MQSASWCETVKDGCAVCWHTVLRAIWWNCSPNSSTNIYAALPRMWPRCAGYRSPYQPQCPLRCVRLNSNSGATWVSATVTHLAQPLPAVNPVARVVHVPCSCWTGAHAARPEHNRLSTGALEAWLNFCCQYLAAQCPKDLRLISCLTIEIAQERHLALEDTVRHLRATQLS